MAEQIAYQYTRHTPVPKRQSAVADRQTSTADYPNTQQGVFIQRQRAIPSTQDTNDDNVIYPQRPPSSARRYPQPFHQTLLPERATSKQQGRRFHWLFFVGLALFAMIIGWVAFNALSSWWQVKQDDWHYGYPRTFQCDAVVGHHDSQAHPSHFIAMNLQGEIKVIELPGGNSKGAQIYDVTTVKGEGTDLLPVTISFSDVSGTNKPDMLVYVGDTVFAFTNTGTTFQFTHP